MKCCSFNEIGMDVGYAILHHLEIADILKFGGLSTHCAHLVRDNVSLWQHLCWRDYGAERTDLHTTSIGLAQTALTWRDYYALVSSSDVLTWGLGSGRTGHEESTTPLPKLLPALHHQGIQVLGKTAEVGSIALSRSGQTLFCWGAYAMSNTPKKVSFSSFSAAPADRITHCSCGHDSGFLLISAQGRLYHTRRGVDPDNWKAIPLPLLPGERPLWTIGSQSDFSGVVTSESRVIWWAPYGRAAADRNPMSVVDPVDPVTKERFAIRKTGFGHREMGGIDSEGRLLVMRFEDGEGMAWKVRWAKSRVVDVDSGSHHTAFATEDGEVYTYGRGYLGMLGHGDTENQTEPKRVEWFAARGMKVVAVGCGGHIYGQGSFTLYLLSDNRLFFSGQLGGRTENFLEPKEIRCEALEGRHILSISAGEDWAGIVVSGKMET